MTKPAVPAAGIVPPLSVSAGLLGYAILKGFTLAMQWRGYTVRPFTPQENTVVQTCAVAGAAIAFSAGFGSCITGAHTPLQAAFCSTGCMQITFNETQCARPLEHQSEMWG